MNKIISYALIFLAVYSSSNPIEPDIQEPKNEGPVVVTPIEQMKEDIPILNASANVNDIWGESLQLKDLMPGNVIRRVISVVKNIWFNLVNRSKPPVPTVPSTTKQTDITTPTYTVIELGDQKDQASLNNKNEPVTTPT